MIPTKTKPQALEALVHLFVTWPRLINSETPTISGWKWVTRVNKYPYLVSLETPSLGTIERAEWYNLCVQKGYSSDELNKPAAEPEYEGPIPGRWYVIRKKTPAKAKGAPQQSPKRCCYSSPRLTVLFDNALKNEMAVDPAEWIFVETEDPAINEKEKIVSQFTGWSTLHDPDTAKKFTGDTKRMLADFVYYRDEAKADVAKKKHKDRIAQLEKELSEAQNLLASGILYTPEALDTMKARWQAEAKQEILLDIAKGEM